MVIKLDNLKLLTCLTSSTRLHSLPLKETAAFSGVPSCSYHTGVQQSLSLESGFDPEVTVF